MNLLPPREVSKSKALAVREYGQIKADAEAMVDLLDAGIERNGTRLGAVALSHAQVARSPFNFFVAGQEYRDILGGHRIFVNVKIVDQREIVDFVEGCLTYDRDHWKTKRFRYIEVEYQYPKSDDTLKFPQRFKLEGIPAIIFQHEIDHANGLNIYSKFEAENRQN